jgi:hypothetical protein
MDVIGAAGCIVLGAGCALTTLAVAGANLRCPAKISTSIAQSIYSIGRRESDLFIAAIAANQLQM